MILGNAFSLNIKTSNKQKSSFSHLISCDFYAMLLMHVGSLEELQMEASALKDDYEQEKQTLKELCQFKDEQVQKAR